MKNVVVIIRKETLIPVLAWAMICLQAGPLAAIPVSERIRTATEKTMTAKQDTGKRKSTVTLEVTLGREFNVTLASNATTGFHWELAAPLDETIVKLVSSTYQAPDARLLGAGGQESWTFKAVGEGQTLIELRYVRPWEKDVPPEETVIYKVIVR